MEFLQVSESLKHQQVDATFRQRRNLIAKCLASLFERGFSQRLNSGSQRANRSRDPYIEALGGFAGKLRSGAVNILHFVGDTVPRQAKSIRTESVGLDNLGPSLKVAMVNPANEVGLGKI